MVLSAGHTDLPVVVNDSVAEYYAPPALAMRYVSLVDIPGSIEYTGTDTIDRLQLALRPYLPFQVYEFRDFAAAHRVFLLYSSGQAIPVGAVTFYDWWTPRLVHDGYSVEVVAADHLQRVYLVDLDKKVE